MQELLLGIALRVIQCTHITFFFPPGVMSMDESTWSKDEHKGETGQPAVWLNANKIFWYTCVVEHRGSSFSFLLRRR
jgi:hypothetical protein